MLGACASGACAVPAGAEAVLIPPWWRAFHACGPWCPSLCPLYLPHGLCSFPFRAHGWCLVPMLCRSQCPVTVGACPSLRALPCPLAGVSLSVPCPPLACVLSLPGVAVVGWGGGGCGAPMAQAWGWVAWSHQRRFWGVSGGRRLWTASRRRASIAACGMVASGAALFRFAGVRAQISPKVCTMCTPSRLPAPPAHFTQRQSSCKAGADHQARWAGAWGGGGLSLGRWSGWRRAWTYGAGRRRGAWGSRSGGSGGWA